MQSTTDTSNIQLLSNKAFLEEIFGKSYTKSHTASFLPDPFTVKRGAWQGYWYEQQMAADAKTIEDKAYNNYFVISTFRDDGDQYAKRRKEAFELCYLVVVDDVISKVPVDNLIKLGFPPPTYKLETSPGNQQWGYVFSTPVANRFQIEYLLSQWVDLGISCDGKDPGMKGVTRYVRLPIGSNTKALYGEPFPHHLVKWSPETRYSIEDLAKRTGVDLERAPADSGLHAQQILPDDEDPVLIAISEAGLLQRKLKPGVFEITCPWVEEHSERADTGAAYLQPAGFRCHHGSCQARTGRHLRRFLLDEGHLKEMTAAEMFADVVAPDGTHSEAPAAQEIPKVGNICYILSLDKFYVPATGLYHSRDQMNAINPKIEKGDPKWTDGFFESQVRPGFNRFVGTTYRPGEGPVHTDRKGNEHLNLWIPTDLQPEAGDITPWLDLGRKLIPNEEELFHAIRWMAQTVQYPGKKINHCLLIAGEQGTGKDTFIEPLIQAVGVDNHIAANMSMMVSDFNDYMNNKKLIVFNEVVTYKGRKEIEQTMKPILAAPPDVLSINRKFMPIVEIPNVVNAIMFSNEGHQAASIQAGDRRHFCIDSPAAKMTEVEGAAIWNWYHNQQGIEKVYHHLLTLDVSDFNPKLPAPMTTFKEEMIEASRSGIDLEIEDAMRDPAAWEIFELGRLQLALGGVDRYNHKQIGAALRRLGYMKKRMRVHHGRLVVVWFPKKFREAVMPNHFEQGYITERSS